MCAGNWQRFLFSSAFPQCWPGCNLPDDRLHQQHQDNVSNVARIELPRMLGAHTWHFSCWAAHAIVVMCDQRVMREQVYQVSELRFSIKSKWVANEFWWNVYNRWELNEYLNSGGSWREQSIFFFNFLMFAFRGLNWDVKQKKYLLEKVLTLIFL